MSILINIADLEHLFIGTHVAEFILASVNNLYTIKPIMVKIN